jgi:tRNA nucleotidyltransferase/poly(A) polymerase
VSATADELADAKESDRVTTVEDGAEQICEDVVAEAQRLVERAEREGLPLRLLGGVAVRLRCAGEMPSAFERSYGDLDWVTAKGGSGAAQRFFEEAGYTPEARFNALHGRDRLLFFDHRHGRQVDVFVGSFRMSHEISFGARLALEPVTIPLAELLVTKLQIYEINRKDVADALALVCEHGIGDSDGDRLNAKRIAELCAADWGLWRTFTGNLAKCKSMVDEFDLPENTKEHLKRSLEEIESRIEREPKSRKWRLRARVGERKRWYELPEEVMGGRE